MLTWTTVLTHPIKFVITGGTGVLGGAAAKYLLTVNVAQAIGNSYDFTIRLEESTDNVSLSELVDKMGLYFGVIVNIIKI
ncbi:MAG: hypothetical protein ABFS35_23495 [Bacteroidota bacterium]